jgi:hypothetical protein
MMLAVVHDHPDILQRKAGDRAGEKHLLDALLHRRHELVRDDPALRLVEELEAGAALARLDAQRHLAELAGAARLLLMAMESFRLPGDRLAIGNAGGRVSTSSLNWLAIRSSTERRWRSPSARSTVSFVVASCSTTSVGILGDHPVQHFGNPLLVAALPRRDRDSLHRHREFERPHVDVSSSCESWSTQSKSMSSTLATAAMSRAPRARPRHSCHPAA